MADSPASVPTRAIRVGGLLARRYGTQARQELSADVRRLLIGAGLVVVAVVLLTHGLLLAHGIAVLALITSGTPPLTAMAILLGVDLLATALLAAIGSARLRKPLLTQTRAALAEVSTLLSA